GARAGAGQGLHLVAELADTGELAGDCVFFWRSEQHQKGEIGYTFNPAYQGRGLATEAAVALLRLGFEGLGLHRITGRLDARNIASARVLERAGMRREAHLVENEFVKGEWSDELVYAMLRREWEARQAGGWGPRPGAPGESPAPGTGRVIRPGHRASHLPRAPGESSAPGTGRGAARATAGRQAQQPPRPLLLEIQRPGRRRG